MKCPKCQTENLDNRKFCRECGEKIILLCPKCGFENLPSDKFCGECGDAFSQLEQIISIDFNQPQSYTPKHLADKILTTRSSIEGERKIVTVFFADVAGYTKLSEKLDPEEVHQIMDGCFKILMDEIHRFEGTINQFTGDGVMALFGAPLAHEDHAQRACHAALSIQEIIESYEKKVKDDCSIDFKMRIGLNTGPVIVGSIGDDLRMDYTAVGDTTNLASRMESMAKAGTVLVSKNTYKLARDFFEFEHLGKKKVKGKDESQEAYKLIKAGDVDTRIRAAEAKGFTKFVGRKNSMAALKDPFENVKKGSGHVVGIVGEAGVGKSRLLHEFRKQLPNGKHTYLEGRCLHFGSSMPYLPIFDIIRSYFDIKEGDREYIIQKKVKDKAIKLDKKLESIVSPILELLSVKTDDEEFSKLDPKIKREKTFEALRDLFIRESQEKPLVLVVEDLHWIDNTTEEYLNYLVDWLANTSIMLILLYRPEYTHQWSSKSYYSKIGLDQLGKESSTELVKAMLDQGDLASELKDLILSRAAGNPLFMEEFTHTLIENGSIQKKGKKYILNKEPSNIQVPDTIQGIIAARMDRLEDNLKQTMQVASVIGRDFAFRILHTITDMREELKSYLQNLQGLEFIYEKSLFPELEYIFKHALTQEVAYNSLLLARRKEIHENIGQAIEEIYSERLEEFFEMLAYHYSKSDNLKKAYHYLKLSGGKAFTNYSHNESVDFLKRAINVLNRMPQSDEVKNEQIVIRLWISRPLFYLMNPKGAIEILEEGVELSKEKGDKRSLTHFHSFIGLYYSYKGDPLQARKYLEESYYESKKLQDLELMIGPAYSLHASSLAFGDFIKAVEVTKGVIELFEKTHREKELVSHQPYSQFCFLCASSMAQLGNFEEAEGFIRKGLRFVSNIKNLGQIADCELNPGIFYLLKGNGKKAVEHFQKALKLYEESGIQVMGIAWSLLGFGYYLLGDLKTAKKYIEKGLSIYKKSNISLGLSFCYYVLSEACYAAGEFQKALDCAEKSLELSQKNSERYIEGQSKISLGRALVKIDPSNSGKAEKHIMQGIKILEGLKLKPGIATGYFCLGELYADAGRTEKAKEALKKAEFMDKEMERDFYLKRTQELLARLEG